MTYEELCNAVADTLENSFSDEDYARFARLTEQRIYQRVQPPALRRTATSATSAGVASVPVPADFLFFYSVAIVQAGGRYQYLLNKDTNYIREVYPSPAVTGQPKAYALLDDSTVLLGPTPDTVYTTEMEFGAYPESIVTASTTWVSDTLDSVLLNGMLLEGARFLKEEADQMAVHEKAFMASMEELKTLADGKLRQDTYRSGQVRVPVK